jgi:RNA polymerase sigma factor (sigma-70 family)
VTAVPFTDRQRNALARHHGYTRAGCARLRGIAPGMDDADRHDIALAALIRVARVHDDININFYFRCLKLEYIDWLRSPRNEGGTTRRGRKKAARVPLDDIYPRLASVDPASIDDRDEADTALAKLPERQRRVLELRYYGGLRDREIGRELGISKATAYYDHAAALERLRSLTLYRKA